MKDSANVTYRVQVITDSGSQMHQVEGTNFSIGRSKTADVRIDAAEVSRVHIKIWLKDNQIWLLDEKSSYGTAIDGNDIPLNTPFVYHPGEVIILGGVIQIKIFQEQQTEGLKIKKVSGENYESTYTRDLHVERVAPAVPLEVPKKSIEEKSEVKQQKYVTNIVPAKNVPINSAPKPHEIKEARLKARAILEKAKDFAKEMKARTKSDEKKLKAKTQEQADEIISMAQEKAEEKIEKAEADALLQLKTANDRSSAIVMEAKSQAREHADSLKRNAQIDADQIRKDAEDMAKLTRDEIRRQTEELKSTALKDSQELGISAQREAQELKNKTQADIALKRASARLEQEKILGSAKQDAQQVLIDVEARAQAFKKDAESESTKVLSLAKAKAKLEEGKILGNAREERQKLDGQYDELKSRVTELRLEDDELKFKVTELLSNKKELLNEIAELQGQYSEQKKQAEGSIQVIESKKSSKLEELNEVEQEFIKERERLQAVMDAKSSAERALKQSRAENKKIISQIEKTQSDSSNKLEEIQRFNLKLSSEVKVLNKRLPLLTEEVRQLNNEKSQLVDVLAKRKAESEFKIKSQNDEFEREITDRKNKLNTDLKNVDTQANEKISQMMKSANEKSKNLLNNTKEKAQELWENTKSDCHTFETETKQKANEYKFRIEREANGALNSALEEKTQIQSELNLLRENELGKIHKDAEDIKHEIKLLQENAQQQKDLAKAQVEEYANSVRKKADEYSDQSKEKVDLEFRNRIKDLEKEIAKRRLVDIENQKLEQKKWEKDLAKRRDFETQEIVRNLDAAVRVHVKAWKGQLDPLKQQQKFHDHLSKIVTQVMKNEFSIVEEKTKEVLDFTPETGQKVKTFWIRVGFLVSFILSLIVVHLIFPNFFHSIQQKLAPNKDVKNAAAEAYVKKQNKLREKQVYKPKLSLSFKSTYTKNVIFTSQFVPTWESPNFQRKRIIALNELLVDELGMSENLVVKLVARENRMVKDLVAKRKLINPKFESQGLKRMRDAEDLTLKSIKDLLGGSLEYERFQKFHEKFYKDYIK